MIGIIMAGGRATRMGIREKLLLGSRPVILNVVRALSESERFTDIVGVTSPHAPETRRVLEQHNITIFESAGDGYVEDLNQILLHIEEPALIISGDMPLVDSDIIHDILDMYNPKHTWTSVLVTVDYAKNIKISLETTVTINGTQYYYTGISLVDASVISDLDVQTENYIILDDKRVAVNLNTQRDLEFLQDN